ncbi:MAG: hypothetical protein JKX85_15985 [Phycisphaeraceae bacterium]|nr:hypothetical protein [Phycisphaeraceae bacterium]
MLNRQGLFLLLSGSNPNRMVGSSGLSISAAGNVSSTKKLVGSSTLSVSTSATASSTKKLSGNADLSITANGSMFARNGNIAGNASLSFTTSASITKLRSLSATSSLAISTTAAISSVKKLSGNADLTITANGTLNSQKMVASATVLDFTASGSLSSIRKISGTSSLQITTAASVSSFKKLTGNSQLSITTSAIIHYPQFMFYHDNTVVAQASGTARQLDLFSLMPVGLWALELSYVDQYGNESTKTPIDVTFAADGHVLTQLREIDSITALPIVAGKISLAITLEDLQTWHRNPTSFEVYDTATQQIIDTLTAPSDGAYITQVTVGPFTHGQTMRLQVRPADANGYGVWSDVPAVVVDALGPVSPVVVT